MQTLCHSTFWSLPGGDKKTRVACVTPLAMATLVPFLPHPPRHSSNSADRLPATIWLHTVTAAVYACTPFYTTTLRTPEDQWRPGMALKFLMSQLDRNWKGGLRELILLLVQAHMEAIISPFQGRFSPAPSPFSTAGAASALGRPKQHSAGGPPQ